MSDRTAAVNAVSEQLAVLMGQRPLIDADDFRARLDAEDADFFVTSRDGQRLYAMVWTPDGYAIHQGEGCAHERFNPTGCFHSRDYGRKTMTQALVKADSVLTPAPVEFNQEQIEVIKNSIAKGATDSELALFVSTCKRTGLDPFMRQIYAVKRWDSSQGKEAMAIQVGIDGMRLIAERTGKYDGQEPVEWMGKDGVWSEVWTGEGHPVAARCSVYRKDWTNGRKATAVCRWESYAQYFGKEQKLSPTWNKMPDVMLGKCAESLALRKAFPAEMSALAASIDSGYDPAIEIDEIGAEYREVERPGNVDEDGVINEAPTPAPITDATKQALGAAWVRLRDAYKAAERVDDLVRIRGEWAERYPAVFLEKTSHWAGANEAEGQELLRLFAEAMPACEHDKVYDDDKALFICGKCGIEMEEGFDEPEAAATAEAQQAGLPVT